MSSSNFWNNFSHGFMHGMFNSNPFFGCLGGWMNPFCGFGGFGGFGCGIFQFNTRFMFPNFMSGNFLPLMPDFAPPAFPNVFSDNIWDDPNIFRTTTPNVDTFTRKAAEAPTTKVAPAPVETPPALKTTPPVVETPSPETKPKISLSKISGSAVTKTSSPAVKRTPASSSLKSKHWSQMTDSEMRQVYGDYTRDVTTPYKGTAADLNKYLKGKGKLEGCGQAFMDAQRKYGISAAVLVGITMNESGKGTSSLAKNKNNVGGVRISGSTEFKTYGSIGECIDDMARFIKSGYVNNKGRALTKLYQVNAKYCPASDTTDRSGVNSYWARNVEKYAKEAEGVIA